MVFLSVYVFLFAMLSFKSSASVSPLKLITDQQSTSPKRHNNRDIRTNTSNLSYPNTNQSFRSLFESKGVPTKLLCRIVNNKDVFCGWSGHIRLLWTVCQHLAESCKDKRLAKLYHSSHCDQLKMCLKPPTRIQTAVLNGSRVIGGRMWMVKYDVHYCLQDESSCGTLVSRCLDNGTWSPIKPKCCQSRFHSRELMRKPGNNNVSVPIAWGFGPGCQLHVIGIPTQFSQFSINLMNGLDILFHLAVRFQKHGYIVRVDRFIGGWWQGDKKTYQEFPFEVRKVFNISIVATKHGFLVQEQGVELTSIAYGQFNGSDTKRVDIKGHVALKLFRIIPNYDFPDT